MASTPNLALLSPVKVLMLRLIAKGFDGHFSISYSGEFDGLDQPEDYDGSISDYLEDDVNCDEVDEMLGHISRFLHSGWREDDDSCGFLSIELNDKSIVHWRQYGTIDKQDETEVKYDLPSIP